MSTLPSLLPQPPEHYMAMALAMAKRGLGNVAENPAVGCIIVKDGRIVGRGHTQPGGRPHAETVALAQAGGAACGADVFVTLEPCSHVGRTPPCAQALIDARVARVWIALADPNPQVHGGGMAMLKVAGIGVEYGTCLSEALFLNQGYIMRRTLHRPLVAAKIATSQDGCMALANGRSQWITQAAVRQHAQGIRAHFDALITGIGTVLADNPRLTCRLSGLEDRLPLRVVIDSQLRLPPECQLVQQACKHDLIVYTQSAQAGSPRANSLRQSGVQVVGVDTTDDNDSNSGLRLWSVLHDLATRGVNRAMLEAGATLTGSFLRTKLIDRLMWYRGGLLLGDDAQAAFGSLELEALEQAPRLHRLQQGVFGNDEFATYLVDYA